MIDQNKKTVAGDHPLPFATGPGGLGCEGSSVRSTSTGLSAAPPMLAGLAAAVSGGLADGGREPAYPVPNRSDEMNRRIAGHEAGGHAFLARALGSSVSFVTIIPGGGFEGRCVRTGYRPSALHLLDESPAPTTDEIVDICSRLEKLTPEIGSSRVESAEAYIRAQTAAIELVGGRVAEQILFPDLPPLNAPHDHIEAAAFARVAVAAQAAAGDLIRYAEAEATALIREHLYVVTALVDSIMVRGVLTGHEVDTIIMRAVAEKALADEHARRAAWRRTEESAASFVADEQA